MFRNQFDSPAAPLGSDIALLVPVQRPEGQLRPRHDVRLQSNWRRDQTRELLSHLSHLPIIVLVEALEEEVRALDNFKEVFLGEQPVVPRQPDDPPGLRLSHLDAVRLEHAEVVVQWDAPLPVLVQLDNQLSTDKDDWLTFLKIPSMVLCCLLSCARLTCTSQSLWSGSSVTRPDMWSKC